MKRINARLRSIVDRDGDAGLTLVEVVIAMMVFSMIAVGVAATITNSLLLTRDGRARTTAANLIAQDLDLQRATADVFKVDSRSWDTTVQGVTYSITRTVKWNPSAGATNACGSGAGTLQFKSVRDEVTWSGQRGSGAVSASTVLAPNGRINDPTLGTIIVAVTGANGAGLPGVNVTIAPTSTPNGAAAVATPPATDANGCTYALKVKPGNYQVTIAKANGIDINQVANPVFTPAVAVAGTTTTVPFTYDTAALFKLNYASNYSGPTPLLPTNLDLTFNSTTGGIDTLQPGSTNPISLFPFSSYSYETGALVPSGLTDTKGNAIPSCLNVDPSNWRVKNSAGQAGASFTTGGSPGALSPTVDIPMGVVKLPNGWGTSGVIATSVNSTAGGDPGCQTGVQYTFRGTPGVPVIALPFGTWKLSTLGGLLGVPIAQDAVQTGGSVSGNTVLLDPRGVVVNQ